MRLRLTFAKTEHMRYTGHLDVHHALERTFRRANLPVAYSQGYNRRPRLNLASALPLGFTGKAELAEVQLTHERPVAEIEKALKNSAPPGLVFLQVAMVAAGTPKLPNLIQAAEYRATLLEAPSDLDARLAALLAAERLPRTRRGKSYDLRPLIERLEREAATADGQARLFMRLAARPGATGRPDEVLEAMGIPAVNARIERLRLILER